SVSVVNQRSSIPPLVHTKNAVSDWLCCCAIRSNVSSGSHASSGHTAAGLPPKEDSLNATNRYKSISCIVLPPVFVLLFFIFNENNRVRYRCMKVNFVIHIT